MPIKAKAPAKKEAAAKKAPAKKETPSKAAAAKKEPAKKAIPVKKEVTGKYEIVQVGKFYLYFVKANNGEIMVTSELYSSLPAAKKAIEVLRKEAEKGDYDIYQDKHKLWQFILRASNKRVLAASSSYESEAKCLAAKESFQRFAASSPVVEGGDADAIRILPVKHSKRDAIEGGKYVIYSEEGSFHFELLANNGHVLVTSMSYASKASCKSAIDGYRKAIDEGSFLIFRDKKGNYQFKFYNGTDGRCIGVGEVYKDRSRAEAAAQSVANFGRTAIVIESK